MGEAGAIVGGHIDRNELRQALYVETEEDRLVSDFFVEDYEEDGKLLVITGSAGDGKSALLSKAFKEAQEQGIESVTEDRIHMDATASTRKTETYDQTLKAFFETVIKDLRNRSGARSAVAINLGLAIDFFERRGFAEEYPELWEAIQAAKSERVFESQGVTVLNLGHRSVYDTHPERFAEGLLRELVDKFDVTDPDSPFAESFQIEQAECLAGENCPLRYNAEQFAKEEVRETVAELLAAKGIIENAYLNPRRILDILASIILPSDFEDVGAEHEVCPIGKSVQHGRHIAPEELVWNTVFREIDDRRANRIGILDPVGQASEAVDLDILSWGSQPDNLRDRLAGVPHLEEASMEDLVRTHLRREYLTGAERDGLRTARDWSWFDEFIRAYTFLNESSEIEDSAGGESLQRGAIAVHRSLQDSLKGWSGDVVEGDYIEFVDGIKTPDYRFLAQWVNPDIDREESRERSREETKPGQLWFVLQPKGVHQEVPIPITFELYILMNRIGRGYSPNARDLEQSEGIRLIHSRLSEFTEKQNELRIMDKVGSEILRLERQPFGEVSIRGA